MEIPDQARTLTTAFLDAHGERSLESLSQRPRQTGESAFLPIHRALFDLARGSIREESPHSPITDIRRILTGVDPRREMPSILSGQVALWDILHRMLWEVEGPHRRLDAIHAEILLSRMASDDPMHDRSGGWDGPRSTGAAFCVYGGGLKDAYASDSAQD